MKSKEELLARLAECVLEMEDDEIIDVANEYVSCGHDPLDGIVNGLVIGMNEAAELYEEEEYFIPELHICSKAMYNGLDIFRPLIPKEENNSKCKIVIGVVKGDTHDIGKNIVKIMLESAGYEMIDLGRDVPVETFAEVAQKEGAKVIALSTLMSTSMKNMASVIEALEEKGIRKDVKVIVGGAPISSSFAKKIGADGYSQNATEAVMLVNTLTGANAEIQELAGVAIC